MIYLIFKLQNMTNNLFRHVNNFLNSAIYLFSSDVKWGANFFTYESCFLWRTRTMCVHKDVNFLTLPSTGSLLNVA